MGVHTKDVSKYENFVNKQRHIEGVSEPFPEFTALLKGE
jgi:hypothetical protein